jgi:hypothetical protein
MSHANEDVVLDGFGDVTPLFMRKSAIAVEWQSLYHGIQVSATSVYRIFGYTNEILTKSVGYILVPQWI